MVRGRQLWGVAVLCVLAGNGWALAQTWPSELRWPFAACIHFAFIGATGWALAAIKREWRGLKADRLLNLGGTGLCLFMVPTAVLEIVRGRMPESLSAAVFCAVPLMTITAAGSLSNERLRVSGLMVPALVGLTGAALLLPIVYPESLERWFLLGVIVVACMLVAVASVWMHGLMEGLETAAAVAVVGWSGAVVLGIYGSVAGWPALGVRGVGGEVLRCAVFDLPEVWLLLSLMREVAPARLSARFLLVPMVTFAEGYAVQRGALDWRAVLGMGLLCAGGVMLLLKEEPEEVPGLHLR